MKKGFTAVEIMIVAAIIGMLAAIGIPMIIGAYSEAVNKTCARNIAEIEKAKLVLTLPNGAVNGAMGLDDASADLSSGTARTNLLLTMNITDISALRVGGRDIIIGSLRERAHYE
ncbi:MAG: prepilin-type N-terminal cleavage/methylation domain-containing protein [Kiritimatiellales bacterium]|jgi:prepilin-type N-terminal cleavage/methylation domain-containing protein